jgi:GNAT superfamily N-acetyltransferase
MRVIAGLGVERAADLERLYATAWWSCDRRRAAVARLLAGPSIVFAVEDGDGSLVACLRILSDGVYKAIVFDVIVDEAHRGEGLARRLLDFAFDDPRIRDVEHVELYCRPEHVPLYRRWGFEPLGADLVYMRRRRPGDAAHA